MKSICSTNVRPKLQQKAVKNLITTTGPLHKAGIFLLQSHNMCKQHKKKGFISLIKILKRICVKDTQKRVHRRKRFIV